MVVKLCSRRADLVFRFVEACSVAARWSKMSDGGSADETTDETWATKTSGTPPSRAVSNKTPAQLHAGAGGNGKAGQMDFIRIE